MATVYRLFAFHSVHKNTATSIKDILGSPTNRLAKQICSYFPVIKIEDTIFTDNLLASFGTVKFNTVEFAFALYFMLTGALFMIGQHYWNRLQVKSK